MTYPLITFEPRPDETRRLVFVCRRVLLLQIASNSIQIFCRLLRRHVRFQPSNHSHRGIQTAMQKIPAFHLFFIDHRNKIIRPEEPLEAMKIAVAATPTMVNG